MGNKIPDIPNSIFLSTSEEMHKFENFNKVKEKVLHFAKNDDFEEYIVKILAAMKIGNKNYSELIFSIDPGTKHLGLVIFLDDYYLNSHTIYEKETLLKKIWMYFNALQEENPNQLKLLFKFGRGIMSINLKIIEQIFENFNKELVRVLLIDESKSSKYKIRDETKKKIPKDEAAALIISLREGFEINYDDYEKIIKHTKPNKIKSGEFNDKPSKDTDEIDQRLTEIAENVLKGKLSLSKSMELIKAERIVY